VTGPVRELFDTPYFFCFHGVVSLVKDLFSAQSEAVHVSYTFDRESALEARLVGSLGYEHKYLILNHTY
jgi:hypothetical protein